MTEPVPDMSAYVRGFDHATGAWNKRGDADDFATFLSAEFGLNKKGFIVDKDGKTYRVYIPFASMYWHPNEGGWDKEFKRLRSRLREIL